MRVRSANISPYSGNMTGKRPDSCRISTSDQSADATNKIFGVTHCPESESRPHFLRHDGISSRSRFRNTARRDLRVREESPSITETAENILTVLPPLL